ncbi:MAG: tRNA pseudouridine(55) synthase TruB [Bacteroidales bacterium]|nr:tRNA pseudouridine(55) synthase TruB [Bacteroidales bacterium]
MNKDTHWTSFDLVNKTRNLIKKTFNIKKIKVGHAGTLDPLASGLMIICTGKFTKKINEFQDLDKTYRTTIKLGESTPSFDTETEVDITLPVDHINLELVKQTLQQFVGKQEQVPPIYSAINIDGKRAYQIARKGETRELKSRSINIYNIEILEFNLPNLSIEVTCSKGTYVRALARDVGEALNTVAHITSLERTKIGNMNLNEAITIKELENKLISHNKQVVPYETVKI